MDHLPRQDPLARRLSLIQGLSWRLYWPALIILLITFALALWQDPELRSQDVVLVALGPILLPLILTLRFFWMTLRRELGWGERFTLFFLRLSLWLCLIWHLACSVYLAVAWASGRGLLIGFAG